MNDYYDELINKWNLSSIEKSQLKNKKIKVRKPFYNEITKKNLFDFDSHLSKGI